MKRKGTAPKTPRDRGTPIDGRWLLIRFLVVVGVAAVILAMIVFAAVVGESLAATVPLEHR